MGFTIDHDRHEAGYATHSVELQDHLWREGIRCAVAYRDDGKSEWLEVRLLQPSENERGDPFINDQRSIPSHFGRFPVVVCS